MLNALRGRKGTKPVDLHITPLSAVKRIEVLRDGAGAQYGSDVVAGVTNIILDDGRSGGELEADLTRELAVPGLAHPALLALAGDLRLSCAASFNKTTVSDTAGIAALSQRQTLVGPEARNTLTDAAPRQDHAGV